MNKFFNLMLWSMLILSCMGRHQPDIQNGLVNSITVPAIDVEGCEADTLKINPDLSKIEWVATEMRGAIKRTGEILLKEGFLLFYENDLVGGVLKVNMASMDITDVPASEKLARRNLLDHLKGNDFFNVGQYPLSVLEITRVEHLSNEKLKISGDLSIREITRNIEFIASQNENHFRTIFTFNRLNWNIAYEGSWADKTLVDKEVELAIFIVVIK